MKEDLTYTEAFGQLQAIVKRMEDADISVDDLADHIKQASKLIKICKDKLTKIEQEVNKNIAELS